MSGGIFIFILVAAIIVAAVIFGARAARKRREELAALAVRLGLNYRADNDGALADRFAFLNALAQGSNRYAFNILTGTYQSHEVLIFDYHYETHSTDSKGNRQTHHHYFSFFILLLPRSFPDRASPVRAGFRKSRRRSASTTLISSRRNSRGRFACGQRTSDSPTMSATPK